MAAARNALLKYVRVNVLSNPNPRGRGGLFTLSLNQLLSRHFSSEEVRGSFLDKSEVTDRVVSVVKNFQKVDPSKNYSSLQKIILTLASLPRIAREAASLVVYGSASFT